MADVYAVKSGNWSDTTLWNTNSLPATIDNVYSNNFTVYVDISPQVNFVTNLSGTGITAGGRFILNNTISLTANVIGGGAQQVACVQFLSASPASSTVYGSLCAVNTTISGPRALLNNSSGTVTVIGNGLGRIKGSGNPADGYIQNASTGTINLFGSYAAGVDTQADNRGIWNNSTGTINLVGSVSGVTTTGAGEGIWNNSTGVISVTGNIFGGTSSNYGTFMVAGTANIVGNCFGGTAAPAVWVNGGVTNIVGNVFAGSGSGSHGVRNQSAGVVNLTGNAFGGTGAGGGAYNQAANGIINIFGSVYGGSAGGGIGCYLNAGTIVITGSAFGGTSTNNYGAAHISSGTNSIFISGAAVGGIGSAAYGAFNNSTGILRVKRAVGNEWGLGYTTAVASVPGVFSNNVGSQTFVEELQLGPIGQWPTGGIIYFTPNSKAVSVFETDTFQNYSLIQSNSADNLLPPVSSVRQGTVYNLGLNTGTCIIPLVSSVAVGAFVDNLSGTAVLTPQTTWNYPVTALDVDSIGGRLRNALNVNSAENLINSFSP